MDLIVRLVNIAVQEPLGSGIRLAGAVHLSNDPAIARGIAEPMRKVIGEGAYGELQESVYLYAKDAPQDKQYNLSLVVKNGLKVASMFSHGLWMTRDNSVNPDYAWAWHDYKPTGTVMYQTNTHLTYNFNTDARYGETNVSLGEIQEVACFLRDNLSLGSVPLAEMDLAQAYPEESTPEKTTRRLDNAWFFIQAMRSQCYLPARIASACTVMEALLSTDAVEITHKIAERTACVLNTSPKARIATYKLIKAAYGVRSGHVHGSVPKMSVEKQQAMSRDCDSILRALLGKAFGDKEFAHVLESSGADLEKWALETILT